MPHRGIFFSVFRVQSSDADTPTLRATPLGHEGNLLFLVIASEAWQSQPYKRPPRPAATPTPGPAEIVNFRGWVPGGELVTVFK